MADLLYTDVEQQLEVALLGMPVVQVIDILASGLASSPQLDTPLLVIQKCTSQPLHCLIQHWFQ